MTFEIGPPAPIGHGRRRRAVDAVAPGSARLARARRRPAPLRDAPTSMPRAAARRCSPRWTPRAERAAELPPQNRELHFGKDEATGRVIVQVRDLDGEVLRTIPPSSALDVMAGAAL